jgi:uncharacterized protein YndB with AHSA1/START domain
LSSVEELLWLLELVEEALRRRGYPVRREDRIGINASPKKVYAALTEEQGLAGWWTKNASASATVGAILHFRFGDRGFNEMQVVRLVPDRRVEWRCVNGAKEWIGARLTFDLKKEHGGTRILFYQRGWKRPVEFMHYCSTKWAVYLVSLKWLLETAKGARYPNDIATDI